MRTLQSFTVVVLLITSITAYAKLTPKARNDPQYDTKTAIETLIPSERTDLLNLILTRWNNITIGEFTELSCFRRNKIWTCQLTITRASLTATALVRLLRRGWRASRDEVVRFGPNNYTAVLRSSRNEPVNLRTLISSVFDSNTNRRRQRVRFYRDGAAIRAEATIRTFASPLTWVEAWLAGTVGDFRGSEQ